MLVNKNIYFTVTGLNYHFGNSIFKKEMKIKLVKEPDNKFDSEAILVKLEGIGAVGHVANSIHTVKGETYSAGRIYDKIEDEADGEIMYVLDDCLIAKLIL